MALWRRGLDSGIVSTWEHRGREIESHQFQNSILFIHPFWPDLPLKIPWGSIRVDILKHFGVFRKRHPSGTDVRIKNFCDFSQFSAKNLAFFSKTDVMITFSAKLRFI
jgi:hypothetical protein